MKIKKLIVALFLSISSHAAFATCSNPVTTGQGGCNSCPQNASDQANGYDYAYCCAHVNYAANPNNHPECAQFTPINKGLIFLIVGGLALGSFALMKNMRDNRLEF